MHYKLLCTKYPMNIASECLKSTAPSKRRPNALQEKVETQINGF